MFRQLIERVLAWLSQLGHRPEPARVAVRVTPVEEIIAARRNLRR